MYRVQCVSCLCVCVCEAPSQNTLKNNFVFLFAVEEILVCSDGSQPEILQGLHRRGGEFTASLFYISRWDSWAVLISSLASVSAGFRPGWRDWPVDLLQCDGVPGSTQLRLPNTRERPWLLHKFVFNTVVFVDSGIYQHSCATRILLPPLTGRCVFCGDKIHQKWYAWRSHTDLHYYINV